MSNIPTPMTDEQKAALAEEVEKHAADVQKSEETREAMDDIRIFNHETPRSFIDGTIKVK